MLRALSIAALLAAVASADTVVLKNGARFEGVTSIQDDKLVIRVESGTVKVKRSDVAYVVHRASKLEEYEAAAAKLEKGDAKGHLALADWCAEAGLVKGERVELEFALAVSASRGRLTLKDGRTLTGRIEETDEAVIVWTTGARSTIPRKEVATVQLDATHEAALRRLGYEKVGWKWLRGEELLAARGMVKRKGRWVTPEEAEAAKEAAEALEMKRLEAELAALEKKIEREKAAARWRGYVGALRNVRNGYEPTRRYRDDRRGLADRPWWSYGYAIRRRHAPGHVVGIGGWIYPFELEGHYSLPGRYAGLTGFYFSPRR